MEDNVEWDLKEQKENLWNKFYQFRIREIMQGI
jgi:hypothetical protein